MEHTWESQTTDQKRYNVNLSACVQRKVLLKDECQGNALQAHIRIGGHFVSRLVHTEKRMICYSIQQH